jgi:hypothetical protein
MATVHVYVRTQVKTDDPQPLVEAVKAVQRLVENAGGSWNGSATVEEAEPDPVPVTPEGR